MTERQEKQPYFVQKPANTYVIDAESTAEMGRLINQDLLVTEAMGGFFPADLDVQTLRSVLDIGCGPGGWAQEVAFQYQEMQVTGIDISQTMIEYARMQARVQGLENAHFLVMDATKKLSFADATFDFVNARFTNAFLPNTAVWAGMVRELVRVARSGGVVRLTEGDDLGQTTSAAFQKLMELAIQAGAKEGRMLATPQMRSILSGAGCQHLQEQWHSIDYSVGTRANVEMERNCKVWARLIQPYIIKMGVASQEELDTLYEQMLAEMLRDDFKGEWRFLSVWGVKPLGTLWGGLSENSPEARNQP
jgi:ubiquinone/menaquinone biosynthesis C-methylase UbiE